MQVAYYGQFSLSLGKESRLILAGVAGVERGRGGEERKKGGGWGERVRDACYMNPLLFTAVDASVRKFLIG